MKPVRTAIIVTIFWTIVVGGMYPLLMYGVGIVFFPHQSQGSLLTRGGKVVGSALIGQDFSTDAYFHSRPSSIKYDPSSSGASNWGWTSADLKKAYTQNRADWQKAHGAGEPPMDMLFASGSGLDPHISPEAAELQVPGVSAARHIPADKTAQLLSLVKRFEEAPQLGFLGEPRVNVLRLNLALDATFPMQK
ncbi:MAG: potassium-transporting ATPase subunit KdpC [Spirochaetia bacterium]|jgi:K+-transporting ATPase ATPase C chain